MLHKPKYVDKIIISVLATLIMGDCGPTHNQRPLNSCVISHDVFYNILGCFK